MKKSSFEQRLEEIANMKGYNTNQEPEEDGKTILKEILRILVEVFLYPLILMYIWDYIMPDLFNFKTITYWQMFLLVTMVQLIFSPIMKNAIKYK